MSKRERPCKYCGHFSYHMLYTPKDKKYSCEKKCKCIWYEAMDNLEYLEWLDEKKQHLPATTII